MVPNTLLLGPLLDGLGFWARTVLDPEGAARPQRHSGDTAASRATQRGSQPHAWAAPSGSGRRGSVFPVRSARYCSADQPSQGTGEDTEAQRSGDKSGLTACSCCWQGLVGEAEMPRKRHEGLCPALFHPRSSEGHIL